MLTGVKKTLKATPRALLTFCASMFTMLCDGVPVAVPPAFGGDFGSSRRGRIECRQNTRYQGNAPSGRQSNPAELNPNDPWVARLLRDFECGCSYCSERGNPAVRRPDQWDVLRNMLSHSIVMKQSATIASETEETRKVSTSTGTQNRFSPIKTNFSYTKVVSCQNDFKYPLAHRPSTSFGADGSRWEDHVEFALAGVNDRLSSVSKALASSVSSIKSAWNRAKSSTAAALVSDFLPACQNAAAEKSSLNNIDEKYVYGSMDSLTSMFAADEDALGDEVESKAFKTVRLEAIFDEDDQMVEVGGGEHPKNKDCEEKDLTSDFRRLSAPSSSSIISKVISGVSGILIEHMGPQSGTVKSGVEIEEILEDKTLDFSARPKQSKSHLAVAVPRPLKLNNPDQEISTQPIALNSCQSKLNVPEASPVKCKKGQDLVIKLFFKHKTDCQSRGAAGKDIQLGTVDFNNFDGSNKGLVGISGSLFSPDNSVEVTGPPRVTVTRSGGGVVIRLKLSTGESDLALANVVCRKNGKEVSTIASEGNKKPDAEDVEVHSVKSSNLNGILKKGKTSNQDSACHSEVENSDTSSSSTISSLMNKKVVFKSVPPTAVDVNDEKGHSSATMINNSNFARRPKLSSVLGKYRRNRAAVAEKIDTSESGVHPDISGATNPERIRRQSTTGGMNFEKRSKELMADLEQRRDRRRELLNNYFARKNIRLMSPESKTTDAACMSDSPAVLAEQQQSASNSTGKGRMRYFEKSHKPRRNLPRSPGRTSFDIV